MGPKPSNQTGHSVTWILHPITSGQGPQTNRSLLVKPSPYLTSTGYVVVPLEGDVVRIMASC